MPHDPLLLSTAVEAALRAGDVHARHFGSGLRIDRKGAIDLVTEVDLEVERGFRALVAERFPGHLVLAEELGRPGEEAAGRAAEHLWIFDPLDGTTNYAHGLPIFCVSVALAIRGRIEIGVIYDASRKELFTAERAAGASLNGQPLRVSEADTLLDSLLCTGFPYDVHESVDEAVGLFGAFIGSARAVRRLGSAAIDLCYVAAGRLDGFWECGLHPWDLAAGVLLVEEAGGAVSRYDGTPFDLWTGEVVASNGRIHGPMVETIREFGRRPPPGTR